MHFRQAGEVPIFCTKVCAHGQRTFSEDSAGEIGQQVRIRKLEVSER